MGVIGRGLAVGAATLALLSGCGGGSDTNTAATAPASERPAEREEPQYIGVTIDGYPGPETAGILLADELGYFADAGLQVAIYTPERPTRPLKYLSEGAIDLAVSYEPQVALRKDKGADIVAVAGLVPHPTAAMIWLGKSQIGGIADLKGRTISYPGLPFQRDLLQSILERAGLTLADVKLRKADYEMMSDLVSGRADAIFGGSWNVEGTELEARGLDPVVTRVEDLGVPPYAELVLTAREKRLARDPESIRAFIEAVVRGNAAAAEHPQAATKPILEGSGEEDPEIDPKDKADRKAREAAVEATLPLLSKTGRISPDQANGLLVWMREQGMIQQALPASDLLTDDYWKPRS